MHRYLMLILLVGAACLPRARAEDADKQDLDDRFGRITSAVEDAVAKNVLLQKRLDQLSEELRTLRDEQAKSSANTSVHEEIRKLADAINEVDRKREADKQLILGKLEEIARSVAEARTAPSPTPLPAPGSDKAYEYEVKPGDRLAAIIAAYNATFRERKMKLVTLKQVEEANPGLNPHKLKAGQKIFIPVPAPAE